MFDVFYLGTTAPGLFAHERAADSVEHARGLSRTRYLWIVNCDSDYSTHDWVWEPPPWQSQQCHAWASQWQKDSATYLIPRLGYDHTNYHASPMIPRSPTIQCWQIPDSIEAQQFDFSWHPDTTDSAYIYQFGTQHQRTGGPRYVMPGATEVKYITTPRAVKTTQDAHWVIPNGVDTDEFDWTWHPDSTELAYIYQFGTQHQRTGGPRYVMPGATEVKYVDQIRIKTHSVATAIVEIDHLDGHAGKIPNTTRTARYFDNYLDTLRRIAKNAAQGHEFVWICSSVCDYTDFDFSWHPEQWQATMLHVFPSDGEKFGDTFFMHVPSFRNRISEFDLLEWYDLNFVSILSVPRYPMPIIEHDFDSHVDALKNLDWAGPLAMLKCQSVAVGTVPVVSLWREKTKTVVPLTPGASAVIIPRAAIPDVTVQIYDYPYINKSHRSVAKDSQQDVVFISNGEPMAQHHWQHLQQIFPAAKHSQGVKGREAAYKAAANLSDTPWFFAVFAKTEVLPNFDFSYQPDRLQAPKHYIFHSRNPLNGLEYGAMNINLYNRQLVLQTRPGLDFTLSALHEVVPLCASISRFNTDAWITWRSAFREVLKLKHEVDQGADVEIQYRLNVWLTVANGDNAKWCLAGGQDAIKYYIAVNGNYAKLSLSFDWPWLQDYYYRLYHTRPWLEL